MIYCVDYINGSSANDGSVASPWSCLKDVFDNTSSWAIDDEVRIASMDTGTLIQNVTFTQGSANVIAYGVDLTGTLSANDMIRKTNSDQSPWKIYTISFDGTDTTINLFQYEGLYPYDSETVEIEKINSVSDSNNFSFSRSGYSFDDKTLISGGWDAATFSVKSGHTVFEDSASIAWYIVGNAHYFFKDLTIIGNLVNNRMITYGEYCEYENIYGYSAYYKAVLGRCSNSVFRNCVFNSDRGWGFSWGSCLDNTKLYNCTFSCMEHIAYDTGSQDNTLWDNCRFLYHRNTSIKLSKNITVINTEASTTKYSGTFQGLSTVSIDYYDNGLGYTDQDCFITDCNNVNVTSSNYTIYNDKVIANSNLVNIFDENTAYTFDAYSSGYNNRYNRIYLTGGVQKDIITDVNVYEGDNCIKYSISSGDYITDYNFIKIPINTGHSSYDLSFYMKESGGNDITQYSLLYKDGLIVDWTDITGLSSTWTKFTSNFTGVTEDDYIYMSIKSGSFTSSTTMYLDKIELVSN